MDILKEAAKDFKGKPVIIVEDIHTVMGVGDSLPEMVSSLVAQLIDLYNEGWINVVYTVSDTSGISLLQQGLSN